MKQFVPEKPTIISFVNEFFVWLQAGTNCTESYHNSNHNLRETLFWKLYCEHIENIYVNVTKLISRGCEIYICARVWCVNTWLLAEEDWSNLFLETIDFHHLTVIFAWKWELEKNEIWKDLALWKHKKRLLRDLFFCITALVISCLHENNYTWYLPWHRPCTICNFSYDQSVNYGIENFTKQWICIQGGNDTIFSSELFPV